MAEDKKKRSMPPLSPEVARAAPMAKAKTVAPKHAANLGVPDRKVIRAAVINPMPIDYGLREFVIDVTNANASDAKLTKEERELLRRQGAMFSTAVAELIETLTKGQPDYVQEYRQHKLWEALGSACVIASNRARSFIDERIRAALANIRDWAKPLGDLDAARAWLAGRGVT